MNLVRLSAGDARVALAPDIGGAIASYHKSGVAVLRPPLPDASLGARGQGSYPLVPFSNRVAYRRFTWEGQRHVLPVLLAGHAVHGVGWQVPWQVLGAAEDSAVLAMCHESGPLWPFAFDAEQRFDLTEDWLEITISITSRHDGPAPAAIGLHPFFPRTPDMRLQFDASHVWHNDEPEKIPVYRSLVPPDWNHAAGLPVGQVLNQCFAGWSGRASLTYPEQHRRIDITADPVFGHLVVFVPDQLHFLAVEPVSNMNDGLNRMSGAVAHGMATLAAGETLSGRVRIAVATL